MSIYPPRDVWCAQCQAKPGDPCTAPTDTGRRNVNWHHVARIENAAHTPTAYEPVESSTPESRWLQAVEIADAVLDDEGGTLSSLTATKIHRMLAEAAQRGIELGKPF